PWERRDGRAGTHKADRGGEKKLRNHMKSDKTLGSESRPVKSEFVTPSSLTPSHFRDTNVIVKSAGARRPYRMRVRAEAAAATRARAVQAAYELFLDRHPDEVTFPAVAERAGVSVPTI